MKARSLLLLLVLASAHFSIVGLAGHDSGCTPTSANPNDIIVITLVDTYYLEERGDPFNTNPPIPGSGLLFNDPNSPLWDPDDVFFGEGTWMYREANGLAGLQRGGTGFAGPMFPPPFDPGTPFDPSDDIDAGVLVGTDQIDDQTCGHGPDTIIMGGAVRFDTGIGGPDLGYVVAWLLSQVPQLPPSPPQPPAPPPGCSPTWASPSDVVVVTVAGETYYVEERGNPANSNPPVPGSGLVLSEGTWVYREANGLWGLQRGGTGMTGPMFPPPMDPGTPGNPNDDLDFGLLIGTDPIDDETCGRGPDIIIMGGALRPSLPGPPDPWPAVEEVQKEADELIQRANDLVNEPPQPNPGNAASAPIEEKTNDLQEIVRLCKNTEGKTELYTVKSHKTGDVYSVEILYGVDAPHRILANWNAQAPRTHEGVNTYFRTINPTSTWRNLEFDSAIILGCGVEIGQAQNAGGFELRIDFGGTDVEASYHEETVDSTKVTNGIESTFDIDVVKRGVPSAHVTVKYEEEETHTTIEGYKVTVHGFKKVASGTFGNDLHAELGISICGDLLSCPPIP